MAVRCILARRYESFMKLTSHYEKLKAPTRGLSRLWRGNENFTLLGRGGRLDAAHIYRCVRVSFLVPPSFLPPTRIPSPSRPPPFAVAFDPAVPTCQCAFSRSCRVRRPKKLAAIDELSRARHVADLPKTRQTHPTSPSTPRPTTGSMSQWAGAEGSGLARRAVPVAAEVLSQVRRVFGRAVRQFLTRF